MSKRDYYEVLGLDKSASADDIKKAYRKLAKKYHPDVSTEKDAESKFKEVQEAYDVLSDDQKKAQYDQFGHEAPGGGFGQGGFGGGFGDFDFSDIFSSFFGGGASRQRSTRNSPRKGSDIRRVMNISFEDSVFGKSEKISIPVYDECHVCHGSGAESDKDIKTCSQCHGQGTVIVEQQTIFGMSRTQTTCPKCGGTGKEIKNKCSNCHGEGVERVTKNVEVKVPAGIDNNQHIRLAGYGNKGQNGGPNGDLYILIKVNPSDIFTRQGDDIIITHPITFSQAALGDEIKVKTPYGDVMLKIPAGTQSDSKFRLRGKGMTNVRTKQKGDQHVIVEVVTPKKLSPEQKKLFEQLSKVEDKPNDNPSIWEKFKSNFSK
ncbi:molecular chaperone DnaJ [Hujiaoplasma nucleasis]|uniref:Chaperone protein DnaJ n=1 Tax=Hujiaoplasma nucleasis TaxID=2725268 RepID=A0A7L6N4Q5_9MOLU|nr:molecular chaperone DnaJ [Hujiaoplasma nucleasis]QLY39559.1 molecular chaperone DnaJ [Hujiaoplasma nucleasis]